MVIKDNMEFYTFNEFYLKAREIKKEYDDLSQRDKRIYKMYVYSNCLLKPLLQDKIWEYLNEPLGSCYYISYTMLGLYKIEEEW